MNKTEKFQAVLTENSTAKTFLEAKDEWIYNGKRYDSNHNSECICGQKYIATVIIIKNKLSGRLLEIGNNCHVKQLHGIDYSTWFAEERKKFKNEQVIRKALRKFNITLEELHEIMDNAEALHKDNIINEWEQNFLLDISCWKQYSNKQLNCITKIVKKIKTTPLHIPQTDICKQLINKLK